MGEIININIGQCGIRLGNQFWHTLHRQHQITSPTPHELLTPFFSQQQHNIKDNPTNNKNAIRYLNRSIFLDNEYQHINELLAHPEYNHDPDNLIFENNPTHDLYSHGRYKSYELKEKFQDVVRRQVERCQFLSGFITISGMGGGFCSGMGGNAMQVVYENYPGNIHEAYSILPDMDIVVNSLEIYNSVLMIHEQLGNTDLTSYMDNRAVMKVMKRRRRGQVDIQAVNRFIGESIGHLTAPYRFIGSLKTCQRKIATNLVLFPRMHYICSAVSPQAAVGSLEHPLKLALKPDEFLISDYFAREHNNLPLLTLHAHIRDNFGYESDAIDTIMPQLARQSLKFVNWLPNPIHLSFSEQITPKTISTVQVNSFHIAPMLIKLSKHFSKIFMRKAFLHRYFADGMDEMQFIQAQSNLNDIISEHTQMYNGIYNDEEYEEYG